MELVWLILGTIAVMVAVMLFVAGMTVIEQKAADFLGRQSMPVQFLLYFPLLALWIVCRIIDLILFIGVLFLGYQVAKGTRNWWHKGR